MHQSNSQAIEPQSVPFLKNKNEVIAVLEKCVKLANVVIKTIKMCQKEEGKAYKLASCVLITVIPFDYTTDI